MDLFSKFVGKTLENGLQTLTRRDLKQITKRENEITQFIIEGYLDKKTPGKWIKPYSMLIPGILITFINDQNEESQELFVLDINQLHVFSISEDELDELEYRGRARKNKQGRDTDSNDYLSYEKYWKSAYSTETPFFYKMRTNLTWDEMMQAPNRNLEYSRIHILSILMLHYWFNAATKTMDEKWFDPKSQPFYESYITFDYDNKDQLERFATAHVRNVNPLVIDTYFADDYIVFDTQKHKFVNGILDELTDPRADLNMYYEEQDQLLRNVHYGPYIKGERSNQYVTTWARMRTKPELRVVPLANKRLYGEDADAFQFSYKADVTAKVDRIYNLKTPLSIPGKPKLAPLTPDLYFCPSGLNSEYISSVFLQRGTILLSAKTQAPDMPRGFIIVQMKENQLREKDDPTGPMYGRVMTVQILCSREQQSPLSTGGQLIAEVMSIASEYEFDIVELDSVMPAVEFYKKQKFSITLDYEREWWEERILPQWAQLQNDFPYMEDPAEELDMLVHKRNGNFRALSEMRKQALYHIDKMPTTSRNMIINQQRRDTLRGMYHEYDEEILLLMRRGVPKKGSVAPSQFSKLGIVRKDLF